MTGLEGIVYEGRNKEYGSYVLRKQYPRNLLWGFIIGILIVFLPIIALFFYFQFDSMREMREVNVQVVDVMQLLDLPKVDMPELTPPPSKSKPPEAAPVIDSNEKRTPPPPDSVKNNSAVDTINKKNSPEALNPSNSNDTALYAAEDVENLPRFVGGEIAFRKYLVKNFVLPPASSGKIAGKIVIEFTVSKIGVVKDVKVISGLTKEVNELTISLFLNSPRWTPASRRGLPVDVVWSMALNLKNY